MTGDQITIEGCSRTPGAEDLDQWFTPPDLAERMADEARRWAPLATTILEPSSGGGALLRPLAARFPKAKITHFEVDPALAAKTGARVGDFLERKVNQRYDLCATNPPYSNGRDGLFLAAATQAARVTVALIRTHALHGVERHASVWKAAGARRVNFLVRRPRFEGAVRGSPEHEFCVVVIGPESIPAGVEWW